MSSNLPCAVLLVVLENDRNDGGLMPVTETCTAEMTLT